MTKTLIITFILMLTLGSVRGQVVKDIRPDKVTTEYGYEKGYLANFMRHGEWIAYDSCGRRLWERFYSFGILEGNYTQYASNRQIEIEGEYRDGQRHGEWIHYDPVTGLVKAILKYNLGTLISKI